MQASLPKGGDRWGRCRQGAAANVLQVRRFAGRETPCIASPEQAFHNTLPAAQGRPSCSRSRRAGSCPAGRPCTTPLRRS